MALFKLYKNKNKYSELLYIEQYKNMLQNRPRRLTKVRRNQNGGDATSLPYEFYNPLAGAYPSNVPVATPLGSEFVPDLASIKDQMVDFLNFSRTSQVGGDATSMPKAYYNPIEADQSNGFFCGEPNNYIDFFYRGPIARNNARAFMNCEPFNPQGETLTGWQAPNAIPPYTSTVQQIRQGERSLVAPQGVIVKPIGYNAKQVGGTCGYGSKQMGQGQMGGGTFGAPFANDTFGCGPKNVPNSGLSYRFNECDLQTGVSFIPL